MAFSSPSNFDTTSDPKIRSLIQACQLLTYSCGDVSVPRKKLYTICLQTCSHVTTHMVNEGKQQHSHDRQVQYLRRQLEKATQECNKLKFQLDQQRTKEASLQISRADKDGSLLETRCVSCGHVTVNRRSPICAALKDKGAPDPDVADAQIPVDKLPRCGESDCRGLLRPNVVFFGETLDSHILTKVEKEMETCDLCLVVGTSSIVYPAAMFGPQIASRGIPVAEFNTKTTPKTEYFMYHFQGPCGTTLPPALARHESEVV